MKLHRIIVAAALAMALLLPGAALAASREDILVKDSDGYPAYNGTFLNVIRKTEGRLGQSFSDQYQGEPYTYGAPGPVTVYEVEPGEIFQSDVLTPPDIMPLKLGSDGALYLDEAKVTAGDYYTGYVDETEALMGFSVTQEGYYFLHPNNPAYPGNELIFVFRVTGGEAPAEEGFAGFTDVKAGDYYAQPVQWAVETGITSGTSDTTFSPKRECTTAEIITFLWRSQDCPAPAGENPFEDVAEGAYYADAAVWAGEQGLLSGGTTFNGDLPCTRSALVTYLWKLAGSPDAGQSNFADVDAGQAYAKAVSWAVEQGITSGTSATTFSPAATCTREQIVTFLYRAYA